MTIEHTGTARECYEAIRLAVRGDVAAEDELPARAIARVSERVIMGLGLESDERTFAMVCTADALSYSISFTPQ